MNRFNKIVVILLCVISIEFNLSKDIFANSVENSSPTPEVTEENIEDESTENESNDSGEELKENSWRYQDGVRIYDEIESRYSYPYAWEKVDGYYRNSRGEIIPRAIQKGIDVSEHNGTINWELVKASGINFAIIRCGYGSDYTSQDDKKWVYNVSECERLGIPYGVYLYSYANTLDKAKSEAQHTLRLLKGHNPTFPVFYDLEDTKTVFPLSASMKGQISSIFCNILSNAGYEVGIYSNLNWWTNYLTDPVFNNPSWVKWVAQYNYKCDYTGDYKKWQCTGSGYVNGVSTKVDIDFLLGDEVPETPTPSYNLQYDSTKQTWVVYKNGSIDTAYTGMAQNQHGWYYVSNGIFNDTYTGMAQNQYGWYYMKNGALDITYTGMAQNQHGWYYMKNGALDITYTGMARNQHGWYYMKNGALDITYTGMAQNQHGWYYMKNGALDITYTGLAQNQHGIFYIKNGALDLSYNGQAPYKGKTYMVKNGQAFLK